MLFFDKRSDPKVEKEKSFKAWLMLLVASGELHCKDGAERRVEKACVSEGGIIEGT